MLLGTLNHLQSISYLILIRVIVFWCVFGLIDRNTTAQNVQITNSATTDNAFGPEVRLTCRENDFPSGYTNIMFQWEHKGLVLSRNDALVDADPSRYSVEGGTILVRNAVMDDNGVYTCRVFYMVNSESPEMLNVSNTVIVQLSSYLPPLNYPECSISPDTGITVGSMITFLCDPGESSDPVITRITRSDMLEGTFTISRMVTLTVTETMVQFMCEMKSDIFPTASRTCSASVMDKTTPKPSTTVLISTTPVNRITPTDGRTQPLGTQSFRGYTTLEESIESTTSVSKSKDLGTQSDNSAGIIAGAVIGGLLILIIVCVIVILIFRRKVEKQPQSTPPNTTGASNPVAMRVDYSTTDTVYSKATIDDSGTVPSPSAEQTASGQARPMSVVYGVVDKTKSNNADGNSSSTNPNSQPMPTNNGDAIYASADNKPSTNPQPSATEPPVYGKVNKDREVDPDENGQDNRESSGMVDNIIYVSSQH